MGIKDIAFPNIGLYLENVPKSFSVFGFEIALYGVIIGCGVVAGLMLAIWGAKRTKQSPDIYWDFVSYAIIFSLVGGRLYYVIFSWDNYKDNLWQIFNIRGGGMAIYGAVIAAFLTLFIYCKIKKTSFFQMADTMMPSLLLGQAIGRYGNFMNREAFGGYTDNLLAMRLPIDAVRMSDVNADIMSHVTEGIDYIQVHPTFFYESTWNLVLIVLILIFQKYKKYEGEVVLWYLGGYGLGRAWVEGLRTDQLIIGNTGIAVSQLLAAILVVFAVVAEIIIRIRLKKKDASVRKSK